MSNVKAKIEEKANIVAGMNDISVRCHNEKRSMTQEEIAEFDKRDADVIRLTNEIESELRFEKSAKHAEEIQVREDREYHAYGGPTRDDINNALRSVLWDQTKSVPAEFQKAAVKCGITARNLAFNLLDESELRTLGDAPQTTGTNSSGKYLIQDAVAKPLERALKYYSDLRSIATVKRTSGDGDYPININDDTSNKGVLIAENTVVDNQALSFSQAKMKAYKFSSKAILVPTELIEDQSTDLASYVAQTLGERISRALNDYHTTGTGSSQPSGIVTGASAGKTAAADDVFTWQELCVDLVHSVDRAYRTNCGFMMNDLVLATVKKFVDTTGRPIYLPSLVAGQPDTINGYPVYVNNSMASAVAADAVVALFGDFSHFCIRDVRDIRVNVLDQLFAHYDQIAYLGWYRGDSLVTNSRAIKKLTMASA